MIKFIKTTREYMSKHPNVKKAIGVLLILIGFISLITPLTPGSWLIIVGLELLGVHILFLDKFKFWKK